MSPQKNDTDPVLVAIARLEERVIAIAERQRDQALKLRWVMAAAVAVVGLVGGPDAVAALSGSAV